MEDSANSPPKRHSIASMFLKDRRVLRIERRHLGNDVFRIAATPRRRPCSGSSPRDHRSAVSMPFTSTVHELSAVLELRLQPDEVLQVVVVEWIGLAEVAAGVELVEPDFPRRAPLLEERRHGLDAGALERAARHVQHGVQVAVFQQLLAQRHRGVVGVRQEGVFDDDAGAAAGLQRA